MKDMDYVALIAGIAFGFIFAAFGAALMLQDTDSIDPRKIKSQRLK